MLNICASNVISLYVVEVILLGFIVDEKLSVYHLFYIAICLKMVLLCKLIPYFCFDTPFFDMLVIQTH